jgi:hypothetical protein
MDNEQYDQYDRKVESVFSSRIRAGKRRTYFFDVRATRANDYFLTITESRKRFDNNGYDRHKIFLYKEDFNKFIKSITEAIDFVKTELMPDFDFDAFNHEESTTTVDNVNTASITDTPSLNKIATTEMLDELAQDIDPTTITEKKPLEARETTASQGDNLSSEEVDKW